jgi:hypothetical protein
MRKFIKCSALCALTFLFIFAAPNPNRRQLAEGYIEQYRYIAIMESVRTGIPASIKLAQGLLESGFGQGKLALLSNNHFGIKWRSVVDGDYVEAFDDEKDKYGNAKSSKFVKYDSPEESYRQHSDLLTTRSNYRLLFAYDRADYRSWAYGLKKAGYASDPQYPTKLISLIEQYNLAQFDVPTELTLEETPQYQYAEHSEFSESPRDIQEPEPSRQPFPTRKNNTEKKESKPVKQSQPSAQVVKNNEADEHIFFEVTDDVASKSIKSPVPRRQK